MKVAIIFTVCLMLVGCQNNREEASFISISKGYLFGAGTEGFKKENLIISTSEEWKTFLNKLNVSNNVSETFNNSFDYSNETIIAVFDKVRNSGGFSIEITEVLNEEKVEVTIKSTGPKPTDMVATAIMQPYHIVKIKKTKKEIKFLEL